MSNEIPTKSRDVVKLRDMGQCVRCGGGGSAWHHRRRRNVADVHQHCPCNGVLLCTTCHTWVHAHPFEAKGKGFIVSAHEPSPWTIPVQAHFSRISLDCEGSYSYAGEIS